jgi:NADP-dependent 3-hydroxy acid dehydrogenase YdfG
MHRQSQEQEQDQEQERVVVVTGSSSGIGYTTSLMLIRNGFYSYATMRSLENFTSIRAVANKERVLPQEAIKPDVNDDLSVKITIEKIKSEKGRIDILVNNAGYGLIGSVGDISVGDKRTI